jgi:hypothetical protein
MTTLNDAKTNGHAEPATRAWNASFARIERRLAELGEAGEQRIVILRDALGEFVATELATRDREISALRKHIAELEHEIARKSEVDQQIDEIVRRLDARQFARDEAKRGPKGLRGEKGDKGDRGAPGRNGISKTLKQTVKIERWDTDRASFTVRGFLSDGSETPILDLRPLFEEYQAQVGG